MPAHRYPVTRVFHFVGALAAWALVVAVIVLRNASPVLVAVVVPSGLAWFSHCFVKHNRPATLGHPFRSW